jgi:hypothetical protein
VEVIIGNPSEERHHGCGKEGGIIEDIQDVHESPPGRRLAGPKNISRDPALAKGDEHAFAGFNKGDMGRRYEVGEGAVNGDGNADLNEDARWSGGNTALFICRFLFSLTHSQPFSTFRQIN